MKRHVVGLCLVVLLAAGGFSPWLPATGAQTAPSTPSAATQQWLRAARLGPHVEPRFDEAALYELAKQERSVSVYSYSSRIAAVGATFEKKYPGIKVNSHDLDGSEIITKVLAEQRARNYQADVIFLIGMPMVKHLLMPRAMAFNYVPPDLITKVPRQYREPFLSHQFNFRVLFYNSERHPTPPVDNLWDLTRPDWKGRVLFPDPLKIPEFLTYLVTITARSDELAKAHQKKYGELRLGPGVDNAGYEWIRRLLANDVIIAPSADAVVNAVGRPGQARPPVGISAWSLLRLKVRNPALQVEVVPAMDPVAAVSDIAIVAIPAHAPHPAAAKLLIRWLMGDDRGGQGFAPYYLVGHLPTRMDVPVPEGMPLRHQLQAWDPDHDATWTQSDKVKDFWVRHLR